MYIKKPRGPLVVTLPDGRRISRSDLPPAHTRRWVASRKGKVVLAVDAGLLTFEEACTLYGLSEEELSLWQARCNRHGPGALKVTLTQKYRQL